MKHKINNSKIRANEDKSNHAVVAFCYDLCPDNKACFYIATGFGGAICGKCEYLVTNGDDGICTNKALNEIEVLDKNINP